MQLKCRLHHVHWLALCPASVWVCVARPALSQINRATAVYTFVSPETSHTLQNTKKTRKYRQRGRGLCRYRHNHILLMGCISDERLLFWVFTSCWFVCFCFTPYYTLKMIILEYFGNIYLTAQNVQEKRILLPQLLFNVGHCPRG